MHQGLLPPLDLPVVDPEVEVGDKSTVGSLDTAGSDVSQSFPLGFSASFASQPGRSDFTGPLVSVSVFQNMFNLKAR